MTEEEEQKVAVVNAFEDKLVKGNARSKATREEIENDCMHGEFDRDVIAVARYQNKKTGSRVKTVVGLGLF